MKSVVRQRAIILHFQGRLERLSEDPGTSARAQLGLMCFRTMVVLPTWTNRVSCGCIWTEAQGRSRHFRDGTNNTGEARVDLRITISFSDDNQVDGLSVALINFWAHLSLRKLLLNEVRHPTTGYYSSLPGETGEAQ